jgi:hypothetical protein
MYKDLIIIIVDPCFGGSYYCLTWDSLQLGGPGPRVYIPQEQGGPVIPQGTGFHFRCPSRLAGLQWRYSNSPPHGLTHSSEAEVTLRLTVSQTVSQYVLASSPLWDLRPDINSVWILLASLCWALSLTRGRVCLSPDSQHYIPLLDGYSLCMDRAGSADSRGLPLFHNAQIPWKTASSICFTVVCSTAVT